MPIKLTILGSTGSIGKSTLDVVRSNPREFEVVGLAANSNITALADQIAEFDPVSVAVSDETASKQLASQNPGLQIRSGQRGVESLAAEPVDVVLCAIVGSIGLRALLSAIEAGNRIALANKEPLVMAGDYVIGRAREKKVPIVPVDSEHSAIYQCLIGHSTADVHRIHLTASGGPFRGRSYEELRQVTPEEAVRHPTWDMGAKISVDSATLMNKGLELIEAMRLFDLPAETFHIVIHPQSIVHSLVEFTDGNILAHLAVTDMRIPIQFALSWPNRVKSPVERLDLTKMANISFEKPDPDEFPCLALALSAARRAGTAPTVLNAANEVAVDGFRMKKISFVDIPAIVSEVLDASTITDDVGLDSVLHADAEARRLAEDKTRSIALHSS